MQISYTEFRPNMKSRI